MKTLVIHPKDHTTDFLSAIYADKKDWTVINNNPSKTELKNAIKSHDRIVMLGHGTPYGLILMQPNGSPRFIIDATWVYLLREKQCVCIWCHANEFANKYELKGFHTGMIISEYEEAMMYAVSCYYNQISESNILFSDCVKKAINNEDENMLQEMIDTYKTDENPIIDFNSKNMFFNK